MTSFVRHLPCPSALRTAALLLACAIGLTTSAAHAHPGNFALEGTQIRLVTDGPAPPVFQFVSTDPSIYAADDPTALPSALLVRTFDGTGSTGTINLNPALWSRTSTSSYEYVDPSGSAGGVTSIALRNKELSISASGPNWTWAPDTAQTDLWVVFIVEQSIWCAQFSDATTPSVATNTAGHYEATGATAPASCPEMCGNGIKETGEICDDGNLDDTDTCTRACTTACFGTDYTSTFEAIQDVVFDGYDCTNSGCHGGPPNGIEGRLDLSTAAAYDSLYDTASFNSPLLRVEPGEPVASYLYEKLRAATEGTPTIGTPMPTGGAPLTASHLEAVRKWIRGGAPRDGVVEGTAALLGTCLPPDTPLKLDPPPVPPGDGIGVQLQQTAYKLDQNSEIELCMATYYDFTKTSIVPADQQFPCPSGVDYSVNNPSGLCFRYHRQLLLQDPQSHHSIIHAYNGSMRVDEADPNGGDRWFGPFTYKMNDLSDPKNGEPCDPYDVDPALGFNPGCSGNNDATVACIGWGPPDAQFAPAIGGSQEPYHDQVFADGVYGTMPMQGVVIWNSHAFNLTDTDTSMAQYYNLYLASDADSKFPLRRIFDLQSSRSGAFGHIFAMSKPGQKVLPFQKKEICISHTVDEFRLRPAKVFELSSHMHQWGVRFRIWEPPNEVCEPVNYPTICQPGPPERLIYTSNDYTDPVNLILDPPTLFDSTVVEDRTYLYCADYDNGSTDASPTVKHSATEIAGCVGINNHNTLGDYCIDGPHRSQPCTVDADCDSYAGAGDGTCDGVCPIFGGVTTSDEMLILLGSYFLDDSPPAKSTPTVDDGMTSNPSSTSFCGLVGAELLLVVPLARLARRRRIHS